MWNVYEQLKRIKEFDVRKFKKFTSKWSSDSEKHTLWGDDDGWRNLYHECNSTAAITCSNPKLKKDPDFEQHIPAIGSLKNSIVIFIKNPDFFLTNLNPNEKELNHS